MILFSPIIFLYFFFHKLILDYKETHLFILFFLKKNKIILKDHSIIT